MVWYVMMNRKFRKIKGDFKLKLGQIMVEITSKFDFSQTLLLVIRNVDKIKKRTSALY